MKKIILPLLLATSFAYGQVKVRIGTNGNIYSPSAVTVKVGDTVEFAVNAFHPTVQVSEATYLANGTAPLGGGFSFPGNINYFIPTTPGTLYYVCTNHVSSFAMKGTITVGQSLGTKLVSFTSNGIQLYPNPATSNVQLKFGQATQVNSISVTNAMGNEVLNQSVNTSLSSHSLDVSSLKSGVYHVIISTPEKRMTEKIVVE